MKKGRKLIYGVVFGCLGLWVVTFTVLHLCYSSNLPSVPDEKTGHIYRMVLNHGFVVYGTMREFRILTWVENSQFLLITCCFIVLIMGLRTGDIKMRQGRKWNE